MSCECPSILSFNNAAQVAVLLLIGLYTAYRLNYFASAVVHQETQTEEEVSNSDDEWGANKVLQDLHISLTPPSSPDKTNILCTPPDKAKKKSIFCY